MLTGFVGEEGGFCSATVEGAAGPVSESALGLGGCRDEVRVVQGFQLQHLRLRQTRRDNLQTTLLTKLFEAAATTLDRVRYSHCRRGRLERR